MSFRAKLLTRTTDLSQGLKEVTLLLNDEREYDNYPPYPGFIRFVEDGVTVPTYINKDCIYQILVVR